MSEKLIRFQGQEYLLIGDLENGGPIATREQYANFECSYAHLRPDGKVMRFRDSIGHRDEIVVIGETEAEPGSIVDVLDGLTDPRSKGWVR